MTATTLTTLPVPAPAGWEQAIGYPGDARYIALGYEHYDDGRMSAGGAAANYWALAAYTNHVAVAPLLAGVDLGSDDGPARQYLLLDRETRGVAVGPCPLVAERLHGQWPALEPGTPEDEAAIAAAWDAITGSAERWLETTTTVDTATIQRLLAERAERIAAITAELDRWAREHRDEVLAGLRAMYARVGLHLDDEDLARRCRLDVDAS